MEMDVDSYLSPIACKTPGVLWSRYSKMSNNIKNERNMQLKKTHVQQHV